MASVNLACPICSDFYENSVSIISTNCGHVFHSQCLQEWQIRSTICPQCRQHISTTNRLYLHFEECSSEKDKQIIKIKSELEQSILSHSILQQQLDASERDFLTLQEQYSKKDHELNEFYKKMEYLTMQNDSRANELEIKTVEIHKLQEALNSTNPQASSIMLQEEINVLKEKIKQISAQLNKEIRNSTQLSAEKMKLECLLEHAKSVPLQSQNTMTDNNKNAKAAHTRSKRLDYPQAGGFSNPGCIQSVVIKNVKGSFTDDEALKSYVLKLSDVMALFFTSNDIEKVSIMERKSQNTMSLIAKFKSISLKAQFLSNKEKLKQHSEMKDLMLYEFVGDNTNSLFHYAKTLKPLGFKHIYCRNNIVFIRKNDGGMPMRIRNRGDIDKLKSEVSEVNQPVGNEP